MIDLHYGTVEPIQVSPPEAVACARSHGPSSKQPAHPARRSRNARTASRNSRRKRALVAPTGMALAASPPLLVQLQLEPGLLTRVRAKKMTSSMEWSL